MDNFSRRGAAAGDNTKQRRNTLKGPPFTRIRTIIRIGSSYYVSIPRRILASLELYRGSRVALEIRGKDIILHSQIKDAWGNK